MRYGLRIVIAGRPNVGKSSLLNRLIEADKAIVTAVPGTTRDPVEATAPIKGITMSFVDTAGIHASDDPVETIGIRKSIEASADADLVLLLIDATDLGNREDDAVFKSIFKEDILLVVNKIDLVPEAAVLGLPDRIGHLPAAFISALDGTGLTELKERIYEMCVQGARVRPQEDPIIADVRHKLCLEEALADLRNADAGFLEQTPLDLICIDLHHATRALLGTTGERIETKILDRIFERFCIGK